MYHEHDDERGFNYQGDRQRRESEDFEEYRREQEELRRPYPNLNPNVPAREWDESEAREQ